MARDGSPDRATALSTSASADRAMPQSPGLRPRRARQAQQRADKCWPTEHAIRIAAVMRALLRLRQGGSACSLRYGAALWLHSSARIPDARAKPKRVAATCTSGCALSGTYVAP